MTETKSPEQAAEEYAETRGKKIRGYGGAQIFTKDDAIEFLEEGYLAGDSSGYQRGKAEERERIWEAVKKMDPIDISSTNFPVYEIHSDLLQQIIFGGGDVD